MNLIYLLILRGHSPAVSGDLSIITCLILGAVIAFITTSHSEGSVGRLFTLLAFELLLVGILGILYRPVAIALGLGWLLMLIVIALYHLSENKKSSK